MGATVWLPWWLLRLCLALPWIYQGGGSGCFIVWLTGRGVRAIEYDEVG